MSNWIIHFLISNIFICIFTLVIIGTKKLLKKVVSHESVQEKMARQVVKIKENRDGTV